MISLPPIKILWFFRIATQLTLAILVLVLAAAAQAPAEDIDHDTVAVVFEDAAGAAAPAALADDETEAEQQSIRELLASIGPIDVPGPAEIPEPAARPYTSPLTKNENESSTVDDPSKTDTASSQNRFHWKPAIEQSLILLGIQHGYALVAQEKTRRAVAHGNFFADYWRSIRKIEGWDDGNRFATNYIAHPAQGGLTGFIFVQNHDRAKQQKFGESKEYWNDRFKAFLWSAAWSTQFELGPISQSSIGNVGLYGGMGYVDLVMTPTAGTAWLVSEEAIDRYVIRHIETKSFFIKAMARMFLNPMRTVANLLRFREPWFRDRPFGH